MPIRTAFFLLLFAFSCLANAFGIRKDGKIDQPAINLGYKESDWERVVACLEGYLRKHGDSRVSVEERIFAYKYLGVIAAADSLSRVKAESYFTRLIRLSPDIEIVDLFPSEKVLAIFQKSKNDYRNLVNYSVQHDTYGRKMRTVDSQAVGNPTPLPSSEKPLAAKVRQPVKQAPHAGQDPGIRKDSKTSPMLWWTLGIATVAGLGTGAYYLISQDPGVEVITQDVRQKGESSNP
jgi:hypothetical protein